MRAAKRSRQTSGRFLPVAMPSLALIDWISIAIRLAREDHPQQQVAEPRAAGDVGREVAGVDVGDGRDEGRAEERQRPRRPRRSPLSERSAAWSTRASPGSALCVAVGSGRASARRRRQRHAVTAIRSASSTAMACRAPSTSTVSGPPNGARSTIVTSALGNSPSSAEVAQQRRVASRERSRTTASSPRTSSAQRPRGVGRQLELGGRDRIAVRVALREAERRVDARLDLLGEVVLEAVGLGVHLVPAEAERLHQVELEQAVVADDLERDALARRASGAAPW